MCKNFLVCLHLRVQVYVELQNVVQCISNSNFFPIIISSKKETYYSLEIPLFFLNIWTIFMTCFSLLEKCFKSYMIYISDNVKIVNHTVYVYIFKGKIITRCMPNKCIASNHFNVNVYTDSYIKAGLKLKGYSAVII